MKTILLLLAVLFFDVQFLHRKKHPSGGFFFSDPGEYKLFLLID
jgi:hypothetical protein